MDIELLESNYQSLKSDFDNKKISAETFQQSVDGLSTQDDYDRHWTIGAETGNWYYYDGTDWAQADPRESDKLPFIDENGMYWMLGQETNEWYYHDGENWVRHDTETNDDVSKEIADETQYYQDDEGRYWSLGAESGEWYYYDDMGWHKADELHAFNQPPMFQSQPPSPSAMPFQGQPPYQTHPPGYPPPGYAPPYPQQFTGKMPVTHNYPPAYNPYQQPYPYPYPENYVPPTQPHVPQTPATPAEQQPLPESQSQAKPEPEPEPKPKQDSMPPDETPEPGAWYYHDGDQWLRYQDDPESEIGEDETYQFYQEDYFDDYSAEPYPDYNNFADESYFDDTPLSDPQALHESADAAIVEDLDDFVEVIEIDEDDIIEAEGESVDAEFEVHVIKPNQQDVPLDSKSTFSADDTRPYATEKASRPYESKPTPSSTTRKMKPEPRNTSNKPTSQSQRRVSRGVSPVHARRKSAIPLWLWTSLAGTVTLVLTTFIIIVGLYLISNQTEAIAIQSTSTSDAAPLSDVNISATDMPPLTDMPLTTYSNGYFGIAINYPSGWVYEEYDDAIVFAPSTRSLDRSILSGATLWVSIDDETDPMQLLSKTLEQLSPIEETFTEGFMNIGNQSWKSAQVLFDAPALGGQGVALVAVASQAADSTGYSLVAIAPFNQWDGFEPLFSKTIDSFQFTGRVLVKPSVSEPDLEAMIPTPEDEPTPLTETSTPPIPEPTSTPMEPTETATPTPTPTEPVAEPFIYSVVSGDTLGAIAYKFDVSIADIIKANGFESQNVIIGIGQKIFIPVGGKLTIDTPTLSAPAPIPTKQKGTVRPTSTRRTMSTSMPGDIMTPQATDTSEPADLSRPTYPIPDQVNTSHLTKTPTVEATESEPTATSIESEATATSVVEASNTPTVEPTVTPLPIETAIAVAQLSGQIIYSSYDAGKNTYNIWRSNIDGSATEIIAWNASQPKISSDGTKLAYRSWDREQSGIYYLDFTNGSQGLLTSFVEDALPTWAPDGEIVFTSRREGDRIARVFKVGFHGGEGTGLGFNSDYVDSMPDGYIIGRGCTPSGDCGLWRLLPNGSGQTKISSDFSDTAPAARPQGGRLAIMSYNRDGAANWEIWTIDSDGSNPVRLTDNPAADGLPTWSADGQSIAFASTRDGVWSVWVMNADGSNQRKLFNMKGSPDGEVLHNTPNSKGWLEERMTWQP
ncbi:MAG: hypothetical protein B6242_07785 [Anaerolineaceae bacterium 4572_78]|nr:MAG: hypothetical protein B6242_07785 [Anaerolineaceae bacterium 4572_78]